MSGTSMHTDVFVGVGCALSHTETDETEREGESDRVTVTERETPSQHTHTTTHTTTHTEPSQQQPLSDTHTQIHTQPPTQSQSQSQAPLLPKTRSELIHGEPQTKGFSAHSLGSIASSIRSYTLRRENAVCESTSGSSAHLPTEDLDELSLEELQRLDTGTLSLGMNLLEYRSVMARSLLHGNEDELDSYLTNLQGRVSFGLNALRMQSCLVLIHAIYAVAVVDQDDAERDRERDTDGAVAFGALILLSLCALLLFLLSLASAAALSSPTLQQKSSFKNILQHAMHLHHKHYFALHVVLLVALSAQEYNDWLLLTLPAYLLWRVLAYFAIKGSGIARDTPPTRIQLLQSDLYQRAIRVIEVFLGESDRSSALLYQVEFILLLWVKYLLVRTETIRIAWPGIRFAFNARILYAFYALLDAAVVLSRFRNAIWKLLELHEACDPFVRLEKPWREYSFGEFVDLGVFRKDSLVYREFTAVRNLYRAFYLRGLSEEQRIEQIELEEEREREREREHKYRRKGVSFRV